MKKVLVLHTGGTISMTQEEDGAVGLSTHHPLNQTRNIVPKDIDVTVEEIFNLPSPHITPKEMLVIKNRIEKAQTEGFDGVVITHGTDTLEETAYFLDISFKKKISVVLTGAMRSSNEIGADGLYNYVQAIITASDDKSKNQGVLVVMNDEIHAARFVTKTHTTSVDTFRTPTFGPIGILSKRQVIYLKEVVEHHAMPIQSVDGKVILVKAYAGMDAMLFDVLKDAQVDGIVIEALGAGNLPPKVIPSLQELIDSGIPVSLVSRCSNGIAQDIYDYEGGGIPLRKMGVMFVQGLTGSKARLRMLVGLNARLSHHELRQFMTE
ncbi:asparaginase [Vagococcus carniphilus]|uniref:asparaginase n=1 Tax=Vagococcus carniphilus TaxID=218144 RepID=A0AAW8U5R8_9ENTE|nr:asparaginase [Vagococcus carniphilus]MDT2815490.1 asparaginase [Vagococcus carniphilus]MDT2833127.1 asparaginase [Vagococcus carniphilus]MDT2864598.1 asparaginase [Vagococcus carniphilus]